MKAICVEVCLPIINGVMGSNAHVVFPPPPLGSPLPSLHERQKDSSGCFFMLTSFCFELSAAARSPTYKHEPTTQSDVTYAHTHVCHLYTVRLKGGSVMQMHTCKKCLTHQSDQKRHLMWCTVVVHVRCDAVIRGSGRDCRGTLEEKRNKWTQWVISLKNPVWCYPLKTPPIIDS